MSWMMADYASGSELLEGMHAFLIKGHTGKPVYTGTGSGYCDDAIGTSTSVFEVITLTFSSATAFAVSGSVTGPMGSGTVGTLFTHARFTCTLVAGSTAWVSGDTVTWVMTAPWAATNYTAGQSYFYQAPGNDDNQEINLGLTVKSNSAGGYFGARLGVFPTRLMDGTYYREWNALWWPLGTYNGSACRLYVVADGQGFWATVRVGTYMHHCTAGYLETFGTLEDNPYPYFVGGSASWATEPADSSTSWLYSNIGGSPISAYQVGMFYDRVNVRDGRLYVRTHENTWAVVQPRYNTTPGYEHNAAHDIARIRFGVNVGFNLDGSLPTWKLPVTKRASSDPNTGYAAIAASCVYGNLPFVRWIPPSPGGDLLLAESTFRMAGGRNTLVVLQTANNSSEGSLFGLEMY